MRILIVGGGIAGLGLASGLSGASAQVVLIDKQPTWESLGSGLFLGGNAVAALKGLGLDLETTNVGCPLDQAVYRDHAGRRLFSVGLTRPAWPPFRGVHRGDLRDALLERAQGCDLRLGVAFQGLRPAGEQVEVEFSNGRSESFDLVVGADGIRSEVRRTFAPKVEPVSAPVIAVRTIVESTDVVRQALFWMGPVGGAVIFPVDARRLYVGVTFVEPGKADLSSEQSHARASGILRTFGGEAARVAERLTSGRSITRRLEYVMLDRWYEGRVLVAGDAAHAMLPSEPMGAAMALEDAWVLAQLVRGGAAAVEIGPQFEDRRFQRARKVQQRALQMSALAQTRTARLPPLLKVASALVGHDNLVRLLGRQALVRAWDPLMRFAP